jgi:hypothetical protein
VFGSSNFKNPIAPQPPKKTSARHGSNPEAQGLFPESRPTPQPPSKRNTAPPTPKTSSKRSGPKPEPILDLSQQAFALRKLMFTLTSKILNIFKSVEVLVVVVMCLHPTVLLRVFGATSSVSAFPQIQRKNLINSTESIPWGIPEVYYIFECLCNLAASAPVNRDTGNP